MDTIPIREVSIVQSEVPGEEILLSSGMDSIPMTTNSSRTLSDLLSGSSPLHIRSTGRGALSTAAFRGTDASHTKVYWNGIRLNSPIVGQVDLSLLPVWFMDDLTLLYGGSSLSQGSGALGGGVKIGNRAEWNKEMHLSVNQEIASFRTWGTYGRFGAGNHRIRSDTRIFYTRSSNNYPYYNDHDLPHRRERLEQAEYLKKGVMQNQYMRFGSDHQLSLHLWYQDADRNLPPVMSYDGTGRTEYQKDRNLRSSLAWKYYGSAGNLTLRTGLAMSALEYHFSETASSLIHFNSQSKENSLYNSLQFELTSFQETRMKFSLDYNYHNVNSRETFRDYGYQQERKEFSMMGNITRDLGTRLMTFFMVRQEHADGRWLPLMPSAGLRYGLGEQQDVFLKMNISRNFNIPSLSGLYTIPGGNPELLPEKAWQGDLGIKMERKLMNSSISTGLNLFAAWIDNWILWRPNPVYSYWEAENVARVFSRGMEYRIRARFDPDPLRLDLGFNYGLSRTTNQHATVPGDESTGRQLVYIPVHSANTYIRASLSGWYMNLTTSYAGKRYTQSSNEESYGSQNLDPYLLNDLHAGRDWKIRDTRAGLQVTVYNIFNVQYQAILSRPMPGRYFSLILKIEI